MFRAAEISDDLFIDSNHDVPKYIVRGVARRRLELDPGQTHFGVIASGNARIVDKYGELELSEGMYFCVNDGEIHGTSIAAAILVISVHTTGLRQFGGPVEETGRLKYVSGCSDTLLLSPPRRGDPCLNHLHIPAKIIQTTHYHPSDRVGIILRGGGVCRADGRAYELRPGLAWHIPAELDHNFESDANGLDVITWHPDSDFGPTDEDHPMINRTWLR
jgi:mannose-6-phosphate isomerase-like protein (cupin superfamily)